MKKYAALLSYAGTRYCGWQKQKGSASEGAPSIQETVEKALASIVSEGCSVVGSGRTDSGVHAAGQVAHFTLKQERVWDCAILEKALNSVLPSDIQVLKVMGVPIEFHAQRGASRKQYSYYFQQGPTSLPHMRPYSWWIRKSLDLEAMKEALAHLVGEHDFKAFQSSGAKPGPTVRTLFEAEASWEPVHFPSSPVWAEQGVRLLRIRLVGSGFLKQMVRGIAGTLLQVGEGRRDPACMREILASQERRAVGPTAPGRGLWLEKVWYPGISWE